MRQSEIKPFSQTNKDQKIMKPFLEVETQNKISKLKKKIKLEDSRQVLKSNDTFLYPLKKPLEYSSQSTKVLPKSKILKDKDYRLAKNIFDLIIK